MGTVYVSVACVVHHLNPLYEVAEQRLAIRERASLQQCPEVRHVPRDLRRAGQFYLTLCQLVLGGLPRRRQLVLPVPQRQDTRRQGSRVNALVSNAS